MRLPAFKRRAIIAIGIMLANEKSEPYEAHPMRHCRAGYTRRSRRMMQRSKVRAERKVERERRGR